MLAKVNKPFHEISVLNIAYITVVILQRQFAYVASSGVIVKLPSSKG